MAVRWIGEVAVDGDVAFRLGRDGDDLVAEWVDLCELRSDRKGERFTLEAREGADPRVVAKVRAGLSAALLRHLRGGTSLHASTVASNGRAVAFLGRSGAGKSTLAAYACARRGFDLLADDVVAIDLAGDAAIALPTETDHWLDAGSRAALGFDAASEAKLPVGSSRIARAQVPLAAILSLGGAPSGREPELVRLRGHAALAALVPCLVRFVIDEPEEQVREIERAEALVARAPLWELRYERSFESLPTIIDTIEELVP